MRSELLAPAISDAVSMLVPVRTITLNLVSLSASVCSPPIEMPDLSEAKLPRSLPPWEDPLSELAMPHCCSSLLRLRQDELHLHTAGFSAATGRQTSCHPRLYGQTLIQYEI